MSLEIALFCNRCGKLMASVPTRAPKAGAMVRAGARERGARVGLPGGADYCRDCWSDMKATRVRLVDGHYIEDPLPARRGAEGAPITEKERADG